MNLRNVSTGAVLIAAGLLCACAGEQTGLPDASTVADGGASDAGNSDAGANTDAGTTADSGVPDGGGAGDAGANDAGASDSGALTIIRQFDGDLGPGLSACQAPDAGGHCDRPELSVASNGTQVVQITWQNVNVYDYSGTLLHSTALPAFIAGAGLVASGGQTKHPYEPHVVYDEFIGRWVITASCLSDCLMVSASADPLGAWKGVYVAGLGNDPGIHLGYDKNGVYVSEFNGADHDVNTANYSYEFFAIPSAEMQWTGTFAPAHLNAAHNTPLDGMPVIDHNANKLATDPAFFLARTCPAGGCQNLTNNSFDWLVNTVTWSGTTATIGADQLVHTDLGSAQNKWLYNTPLNGPQPGTATLRLAESHRVINAIQDGRHVHAVMGSGPCVGSCGAQGADSNNVFFWVDLDCTSPSACAVSQTAKVSSANEHYAFPTVGVDSNGNVGVVAAAFSSSQAPSIRAWRHLATDAANTVSGPTAVTLGTQPYTCMANPVTYATAVGLLTDRDPLDGTKLWTTHQYGNSSAPCVWTTRIVQYQLW